MCTAGTDFIVQLKDAHRWLLTTKHRLRGVDNSILDIKGALIVDIKCSSGRTTEILYVCDKVKGIYLETIDSFVVNSNFCEPSCIIMKCFIKISDFFSCMDVWMPYPLTVPTVARKILFPATPEHREPLEKCHRHCQT